MIDVLRRRAERLERRFTSPGHDEAVAARLGVALGVSFTVCALTGAYSHLQQHDPTWLDLPSRPVGLYRVTQGVHVATGVASIPLLFAKLWAVAPRLLEWPPFRSVAHAIERLALLPLVGAAVFLLMSGVANVARWYPWTFFFPAAHLWAAWIAIGALIVHVGATIGVARRELRPVAGPVTSADRERRRFLGQVVATSTVLVVATIGGTVGWLSPVSFLAQRRPTMGPQGLPVNKSAAQAGVEQAATDAAYRLTVVAGEVHRDLTLDELRAMPQRTAVLPIACVEGWSASASWRGVAVRGLLDLVGAPADAAATVTSLQTHGLYASSELNPGQVADPDTLLALELDGEPLHLDHGYPVRLIAPNRPGVGQTKWVHRLEAR